MSRRSRHLHRSSRSQETSATSPTREPSAESPATAATTTEAEPRRSRRSRRASEPNLAGPVTELSSRRSHRKRRKNESGEPSASDTDTNTESRRSHRARRKRPVGEPRPSRARSSEPTDVRAQLKFWLGTLDTMLSAIEKTAWQTRALGEKLLAVFQGGPAEDDATDSEHTAVTQIRTLRNELTEWPKRITRLTSTGIVLGRIGASYRFHNTKAAFMSPAGAVRARQELHEDSARRLYELSIKHGGAFLKLGQMLSSRPDLLPEAYVRELGKLQDAAPAVPFELIRTAIESELGRPLAEVFADFSELPVAAASIGQVHRATLLDGRKVAVKVQRPNIAELVALDMELLEIFVRALAESLPPLDFDTIIRETRAMVTAELDYEREAKLTARLSTYFAADASIHVPQVVSELSTSRLLVTMFMPGEKITNVLDRLQSGRDAGEPEAQQRLTALLSNVLEAYARQVLEVGVFQADPHPGNLLADETGQLTVLDFGCAKELDHERRAILLALLRSTVTRDTDAMADAMLAMGFKTQSGGRDGLRELASAALAQMALVKGGSSDFCSQLEMVARIAEFGRHIEGDPIVCLPEEFVMLGRVFGTLSGLFVHYQPDVSATSRVLPVVFSALMQMQAQAAA